MGTAPLRQRRPPIIAVTGPDSGGGPAWLLTKLAVWRAGGRAVRVTPANPYRLEEPFHGVVLGGGADIGPDLYGAVRKPPTADGRAPGRTPRAWILDALIYPALWLFRLVGERYTSADVDAPRDALELAILEEAVQRDCPVLGICRGEQLINIFFGGTLHQELRSFYAEDPEIRTVLPRKRVVLDDSSILAQIIGTAPLQVNALHRQGVASLGRGLRVVARDKYGVVQALEHPARRMILGVQWHPEFMPQVQRQQLLFIHLVCLARMRPPDTEVDSNDRSLQSSST
ncbi:MAG: gamma-glutamyl-gamma-aminobutyrate hydrolase family protein [Bdellovibrionales bacterium]|nr:gamma-glutamyl-gamma-aminobutyrate hydrolase family protein [Bdellovibrionales bacterium]